MHTPFSTLRTSQKATKQQYLRSSTSLSCFVHDSALTKIWCFHHVASIFCAVAVSVVANRLKQRPSKLRKAPWRGKGGLPWTAREPWETMGNDGKPNSFGGHLNCEARWRPSGCWLRHVGGYISGPLAKLIPDHCIFTVSKVPYMDLSFSFEKNSLKSTELN